VSSGLLALLDDVAGIAKMAAASLDDAIAQSGKAGTKALGVVIDDAAVTPRYVTGFAAKRELPIVWQIALGSLRNKLLFLLPAALLLDYAAPWAVTPLLMLGGLYLCFEGFEKVVELVVPHAEAAARAPAPRSIEEVQAAEKVKVQGAIRTDFILSAEIMAIVLAGIADAPPLMQATVLAAVGLGITALVYGVVALIVKADDAGVALARNSTPVSSFFGLLNPFQGEDHLDPPEPGAADRALRPATQAFGRLLVRAMPPVLKVLGLIGTAAMLWVGGGIVVHGLAEFGYAEPEHVIHDLATATRPWIPDLADPAAWLATAGLSGLLGLVLGGVVAAAVALARLSFGGKGGR
jgi:predicted DNA repair protein MutK